MVSGVPLETCWAFNERWNNKFCYKVASCWLFLLNKYRLSKLPIRCDTKDIRRPIYSFEDGCTKKEALISFKTYVMIQRGRLENKRNKYYFSLYLTCQVVITNMKIKGFQNRTRALIDLRWCCWRCRSSGMGRHVIGRTFPDVLKDIMPPSPETSATTHPNDTKKQKAESLCL